ncbi:TraM recognition domain-containing protein [bacterium]|nr:TraM recognition domain-containing protein [bacterium]
MEGTLILGSTGSGKSSGPGKFIAKAMLKAGYGFCVLCAKPDERKRWLNYANETGRGNDVVLFNKDSGLKFDFLQYEMERTGEGAGDVINIVNALMSLNEQNKIHQTGGESKDEAFWNNATRRLIGRTATFLRLAGEAVNIRNMRRIVAECFRGKESDIYDLLVSKSKNPELDDLERNQAQFDLTRLINSSFFLTLFERISAHAFGVDDQEDATMVLTYFKREFPRISERTQSIIIESFNGIVEPWFNRGILKSQFSDGISADLLPENIAINKKIIIVDFPIKEFGLSGIYAATIYKTCFQAAMERREVHLEPDPTPACLWIDEYQSFCSPLTDSLFQVTARSAWVATVCITQNINNLYFVMSGNEAQARAKSLLGNLNLKFFASNADYETNTWGSDMIGKHMADVDGLQYSDKMEISKTKNQQIQYRISPDHFTTLKTGRKANNYIVETVVFKAGKVWGAANDNYAQIEFNQLAS